MGVQSEGRSSEEVQSEVRSSGGGDSKEEGGVESEGRSSAGDSLK